MSRPRIDAGEMVYKQASDVLTVAEKRGDLARAVAGDPAGLDEFKTVLSGKLCYEVIIKDAAGAVAFRDDTGCTQSTRIYVARRSFVEGGEFYTASLFAWYR